jgi:hypothetical protein
MRGLPLPILRVPPPSWVVATAVVEELARTSLDGHPIDSATGHVLAPD